MPVSWLQQHLDSKDRDTAGYEAIMESDEYVSDKLLRRMRNLYKELDEDKAFFMITHDLEEDTFKMITFYPWEGQRP